MSAYVWGAMLAMGLVTLACRAAPFLFFMKRRPPAFVDFLQLYIPPMIMTVLVLNCFKSVRFAAPLYGIPGSSRAWPSPASTSGGGTRS